MRTEPAALRPLCGRDEISIDGVDTRAAVALLARVLEPPRDAARLHVPERDALLATLHRRCWGDRIVATLTCEACAAPFDLSFELSAMQRSLAAASAAAPWRADGDGRVVDEAGTSYGVPDGSQELEAAQHAGDEAVRQLAVACGATGDRVAAASDALEAAAPILDLELRASCAACGHEQLAHFDLQSFVLQRLLNERGALIAEMHLLATSYGWPPTEILALPRQLRRELCGTLANAQPRTVLARGPRAWQ